MTGTQGVKVQIPNDTGNRAFNVTITTADPLVVIGKQITVTVHITGDRKYNKYYSHNNNNYYNTVTVYVGDFLTWKGWGNVAMGEGVEDVQHQGFHILH